MLLTETQDTLSSEHEKKNDTGIMPAQAKPPMIETALSPETAKMLSCSIMSLPPLPFDHFGFDEVRSQYLAKILQDFPPKTIVDSERCVLLADSYIHRWRLRLLREMLVRPAPQLCKEDQDKWQKVDEAQKCADLAKRIDAQIKIPSKPVFTAEESALLAKRFSAILIDLEERLAEIPKPESLAEDTKEMEFARAEERRATQEAEAAKLASINSDDPRERERLVEEMKKSQAYAQQAKGKADGLTGWLRVRMDPESEENKEDEEVRAEIKALGRNREQLKNQIYVKGLLSGIQPITKKQWKDIRYLAKTCEIYCSGIAFDPGKLRDRVKEMNSRNLSKLIANPVLVDMDKQLRELNREIEKMEERLHANKKS